MVSYRDNQAKVTLLERCRALRRSATNAESLLWRLLRARQVAGAKFRRQHQFGPYILDFYCHEQALVVEVDGGQHTLPIAAGEDAARTRYLQSRGLKVLRFTNLEVLQQTEAVVTKIWEEVEEPTLSPSPQPSPKGRGSRAGTSPSASSTR